MISIRILFCAMVESTRWLSPMLEQRTTMLFASYCMSPFRTLLTTCDGLQ